MAPALYELFLMAGKWSTHLVLCCEKAKASVIHIQLETTAPLKGASLKKMNPALSSLVLMSYNNSRSAVILDTTNEIHLNNWAGAVVCT